MAVYTKRLDYEGFLKKFKRQKTTDDCYTPKNVYNALKKYVLKKYNIASDRKIVRPFHPNGDYEMFDYPDNCLVLDNQPFSLTTKIIQFYNKHKIDYFLFAPGLTCLNLSFHANIVIAGINMIYSNGATILTSFVTNLGDYKIDVDYSLYQLLIIENDKNNKRAVLPKINYPDNFFNISKAQSLLKRGFNFKLKDKQVMFISKFKNANNNAFGGGMLTTDDTAQNIKNMLNKKRVDKVNKNVIDIKLHKAEINMIEQLKD
jgi:hypothetical protein